MRVGILSLMHESNTFVHDGTELEQFEADTLLRGEQVREIMGGGHHEVSGFFDGLKQQDIEAVPIFMAFTTPSGTITKDAAEKLLEMMFVEFDKAGELDGLLVAPHGAGVSEPYPDLDGHWLSEARKRLGNHKPMVCTIDPHANLTSLMIETCDATTAYRTNPHLDQRDRGIEAATIIGRMLRDEIKPTQRASFPAMAINIERQLTRQAPCLPMYEKAQEVRDRPGVLSVSIVLGFPYSDVEEMGTSFIVVTDNDPQAAQQYADELARYALDHRADFVGQFNSVEDSVEQASNQDGPICLLDMGDNVGGGSAADGTFIAHEVHRRGNPKTFVSLYDPEAQAMAREAGVGNTITMKMGGKTDEMHGPPLEAKVRVVSLHDGKFEELQARHGGKRYHDMGHTAIVSTDAGLTLQLTSRRVAPFSLGQVTSCDIEPSDFQILVAKGVHAPVAAYEPVCKGFIRVNTQGSTSADMRLMPYKHRRKPLYPFEEI